MLMNHINSVKCPGLANKSPYELVEEDDMDFRELMRLLKMHLILPDEVHLMPDLFVEKLLKDLYAGSNRFVNRCY